MDWQAFGAISNAVLVLALISVTIYYAIQTNKQARSMQLQITWDRTYGPRLDAYRRFMNVMSKRPIGDPYIKFIIVPQLELIQPASDEVRRKAKELYEYAEDHRINNKGEVPIELISRINKELKPIIVREIEEITKEKPLP